MQQHARGYSIYAGRNLKADKVEKELIKRYFNNTASPEEEQLVSRWLINRSLKDEVLSTIEALWEEQSPDESAAPPPFHTIFEQAMAREKEAGKLIRMRSRRRFRVVTAAACVAFLFAGIGIGYYLNRDSGETTGQNEIRQLTTSTGEHDRMVVMLSNGTEVVLNAASRLMFDEEENNVTQTVYLEGEASFDLREANKPLIIKTKDLITTTRGAQLNISAPAADSMVRVTVKKGRAEVKPNTGKFAPMLRLHYPGNKDSLVKDGVIAVQENERKPGVMPLVKLRPAVIIREKEQMTFNRNNGFTDIGINTEDSTTVQP